jgi:hypothetical protein
MKNQTMYIAIAMVTGQSAKVAAGIFQKLHSVVGYIVYFSNIRKIPLPYICLGKFVSVLMQYAGWDSFLNGVSRALYAFATMLANDSSTC